ncbi:MAG: transcriptional regulator [Verrucomicrobiales bacterium]|nr:transcriptional regulator [Verrucomicrobiales bacterium]
MRRRDFIPLLLDRPKTLSQLARETRLKPGEVAEDIEHLLRSLRHLPFRAEWTPARCRKCGFEFDARKLGRPSRCPECRGTWIAEACLCVREQPAGTEPGTPL